MSKGKAFFSTLPGIISALAGLVTVIVGVLAISAQMGWLSDEDDEEAASGGTSTTTVTSVAGSAGGSSTTISAASLSVAPRSVTFAAVGTKNQTVTVRNDGAAAVTLQPPSMSGPDNDQFDATTTECRSPLGPGRSCAVEITFAPTRPGQFTARLVVAPAGGGRAVEVPVDGSRLI